MKIAFATTDMKHVNDHFGWAKTFALYEVDSKSYEFLDNLKFEEGSNDREDDKLKPKIEALSDCAIVYSANIGSIAAARLVKHKIHPVKSTGEESIELILQRLTSVLKKSPPPWLKKILNKERSDE